VLRLLVFAVAEVKEVKALGVELMLAEGSKSRSNSGCLFYIPEKIASAGPRAGSDGGWVSSAGVCVGR
jgi:hypothetical protein